ncbi:hypothetical protein Tco_0935362 [Tanacetum coccineum]
MVPRIVLTRSGLISLNTARLVNTVQPRTTVNNAGPLKNVINNAYSTARRPFNKITTANNSNFTKKVNIVKDNPQQEIMKKLMEDLLPLEEIPKDGKLLGKKNSYQIPVCLLFSQPDVHGLTHYEYSTIGMVKSEAVQLLLLRTIPY